MLQKMIQAICEFTSAKFVLLKWYVLYSCLNYCNFSTGIMADTDFLSLVSDSFSFIPEKNMIIIKIKQANIFAVDRICHYQYYWNPRQSTLMICL